MRPAAAWMLLLAAPTAAWAQPGGLAEKLTVSPRAAPEPALRYRLLPPLLELKPGNAANFYYRALLMRTEVRSDPIEDEKKLQAWEEKPVGEMPAAEAREFLGRYRNVFKELELGAHAAYCDWQFEGRLKGIEGISLLLPEIQSLRDIARLLSLQIKVEIAERRFDEAVRWLRTGFAMARHVGNGDTLIQSLVGMAFVGIFSERVEELIQQPGAPNLYWALTALPRPFIDLRRPLTGELRMQSGLVPDLAALEKGPLSVEEANRLLHESVGMLARMAEGSPQPPAESRLALAGLVALRYVSARQDLLAEGMAEEQVNAMPTAQVVMLASAKRFARLRDDFFKWMYLPYAEARKGLAEMERRLRKLRAELGGRIDPGVAMFVLLVPALEKVHEAAARTDRRIALLRAVEAVRIHAAAHGGKLPASLFDVTEAPVPNDPLTGAPFGYKLRGNTISLVAPAPEGQEPHRSNSIFYELEFGK